MASEDDKDGDISSQAGPSPHLSFEGSRLAARPKTRALYSEEGGDDGSPRNSLRPPVLPYPHYAKPTLASERRVSASQKGRHSETIKETTIATAATSIGTTGKQRSYCGPKSAALVTKSVDEVRNIDVGTELVPPTAANAVRSSSDKAAEGGWGVRDTQDPSKRSDVPLKNPGNMSCGHLVCRFKLIKCSLKNASHPIMNLKKYIPVLKNWGTKGVKDIEDAFERVEHSGFSEIPEDSPTTRSARERYANREGQGDLRDIEKFFFKITNMLKKEAANFKMQLWLWAWPAKTEWFEEVARVSRELIYAFDTYLELLYWT